MTRRSVPCAPAGRICVLDFGLVSEVTEEQRVGLVEFIAYLTMEDWDSVARWVAARVLGWMLLPLLWGTAVQAQQRCCPCTCCSLLGKRSMWATTAVDLRDPGFWPQHTASPTATLTAALNTLHHQPPAHLTTQPPPPLFHQSAHSQPHCHRTSTPHTQVPGHPSLPA